MKTMKNKAFEFMQLTPLNKVPKGSKIDVTHMGLSYQEDGSRVSILTFHHLDGMYSYCTDEAGNVVHLRRTSPVIIIKDDE